MSKTNEMKKQGADHAETKNTVCGLCFGYCGLKLEINGGKLTGVSGDGDHFISKGHICPKGRAATEIINSPDRVKAPMKKRKDGGFEEISWENAFDYISGELVRLKKSFGPEALAVNIGQTGVYKEFWPVAERFTQAFGSPNFSTAGSHCHMSKTMASVLTYGAGGFPDYENSNFIVLWGYNPHNTCPPQVICIREGLKKGSKLMVVDTKKQELSGKADFFLQPRPGSDCALVLAMIHVIIMENLYDEDFVSQWTIGFDRLAEHCRTFTPEWAGKISGVPADMILRAAREYAAAKTACIYPGNSLEMHTNGFQTTRAIAFLQAITGNLDVRGGSIFIPPPQLDPLTLPVNSAKPAIGSDRYPLFHEFTGQAQANLFCDAILDGIPYPLKGMIVAGANPIMSWANASRVKKALSGLDLLVVMEQYMNESAQLADIILPSASYWSCNEFWISSNYYGIPRIGYSPPVMEDGNSMSNVLIFLKLAKKLGMDEAFPWNTEEEILNHRIKPLGITLEELKQMPRGHEYARITEKKYMTRGFNTPSGKVELYSERLEIHGYDPLPLFRETSESPHGNPGIGNEYPFTLTAGSRTLEFINSRYHNIPYLVEKSKGPIVEIHPETARQLNISDGEAISVESPRGSITLNASISEAILPGNLRIPQGWPEANANELTDNSDLDPVSGFPPSRTLVARLVKRDHRK